MGMQNSLESLHSPGDRAFPGYWKLAPGQAISLQPREAGLLRIAQGQVWLTLDGPHTGHGNESGDQFLKAGQGLGVRAGQRLVFEPCGKPRETPVYFEWMPGARVSGLRRWPLILVQSFRTFGLTARLALGLDWRAFRAASSASRAQGAIEGGDSMASSGAL